MRLNDHGNTKLDYERAQALRNDPAPCEKKLWVVLREQAKLHGLKFRRQHAVHPYIADFACLEARVLIELDGMSHDNHLVYDAKRDDDLMQRGFSILRFGNEEVLHNVEGVVEIIIAKTEAIIKNGRQDFLRGSPLPDPPHEGEGMSVPAKREFIKC